MTSSSQTDHQIIRALGRKQPEYTHHLNQNNHRNNNLEKNNSNLRNNNNHLQNNNSNLQTTHPESSLINNLRSTTCKLIRSITPASSAAAKKNNNKQTIHHALNPTNLSVWNQQQRSNNPAPKTNQSVRSNSIASIYPHHQPHHQPISSSSTDSIHTHPSHSTHPIRTKLERKFTQIYHKFNQHQHHQPNSNHTFSSSIHHHQQQQQPKLKSTSSSSLSCLFHQPVISHLPPIKTDTESTPKLSPSRPKEQTRNATQPNHSSLHYNSQQDNKNLNNNVMMMTSRSNQTPHTIYLPIEHDPISFTSSHPPHLLHPNNNHKNDKRQSPTQVALSRLDEILRGHHHQKNKMSHTLDENSVLNYAGYQSVTKHTLSNKADDVINSNPHNNTHHIRSSSSNKLLKTNIDMSINNSLSPPLRSCKKNQTKSNPDSNSSTHHHSQSLNNHHVFINPETWKSISISGPKFRHHSITSLD